MNMKEGTLEVFEVISKFSVLMCWASGRIIPYSGIQLDSLHHYLTSLPIIIYGQLTLYYYI